MSKMLNKFSVGVALAVGVAFLAYQQSDTSIEDVGESIALKLIEILPRKNKVHFDSDQDQFHEPEDVINTTAAPSVDTRTIIEDVEDAIPPSKESSFDPVGHYNAKQAMQNRYDGLREVCKKYADYMRPEKMMTSVEPDASDIIFYPSAKMTFCPINKVAKKSFTTLFTRMRDPGPDYEAKLRYFSSNYPRPVSEAKRAIMVRHPMERIVSAYRYTFERSYNAATGEEEGGEMSFSEFADILIHGAIEFSNFLEENEIAGESVAIDTSMIDGEGVSNAWNPFWRQCGVCNPTFQPHYILHMGHFKEDTEALMEVIGSPDSAKSFLATEQEPKSGLREVEEHYFSQLTKTEIRQLYEKYRFDHELFGFTPDYYIALGQDS